MSFKMLDGIGWKARGDRTPEFPNPRPFFPRIKHAIKLIPLLMRIVLHTVVEWWHGREAFIDIFNVFRHFTYTGVPIGGIGCGSIGTDYRGAFGRFSIIPGIKEQTANIKADQFIVSVHSKLTGSLIYQSLLSCADFNTKTLETWKTMPKENVRYRGLFPRAWTEFKLAETGTFVICEQLSPVIPHDYKDSSLPVANFEFHVVNESDEDVDVSIAFTFRNGTGNKKWNKDSVCRSELIDIDNFVGRTLQHTVKGMQVTYGIGTNKSEGFQVTTSTFDPDSKGKDIYQSLSDSGALKDSHNNSEKELGIAVCSKFSTLKKTSNSTTFSLTWYMPEVHFGTAERNYIRRYVRFFNRADCHQVTGQLCQYANRNNKDWRKKIEGWQNPILQDENLPEWYRSALFNELYFIVDGSTTWFEYSEKWKMEEPLISSETEQHMKEYGRFGYMESWEYYMINTYDVHFYSSWAILKNWPQIELSIQLDFADQVSRVDKSVSVSLSEGTNMEMKRFARIPHDMGHPMSDPWIHTNAYILHDTSEWKDLNLKFVLSCWRDWKFIAKSSSNSQNILQMFYEKSKLIIDRALQDWDIDGDGMIENSGFADQTYDVWTMTGTSAYCGSLWIASLKVFVEMGTVLKQTDVDKYSTLLHKSYLAFEKKLWNGKFFFFDENPKNKNVVMADQLSGFWALATLGEKIEIDEKRLVSALRIVYAHNVRCYSNGEYGAVNGFLITGEVDSSSIQSEEVWAGITYALSSMMITMDLPQEAFKTSEGIHNSIWYRYPLQFQTPEAMNCHGMYRALGYMRPMSIWAIQHSIEQKKTI